MAAGAPAGGRRAVPDIEQLANGMTIISRVISNPANEIKYRPRAATLAVL
jgi:hypothetical protein